MAVTTDLVEAFLKCPTKCFLRAHTEVETGNAYAEWVRTEGDAFRSEGIKRLVAGVAPDKCVTGAAATESVGSAQWYASGQPMPPRQLERESFGRALRGG